ncbi:MAG: GTPase Era [Clostridia bacterium]|nr:GTPase Era [Clostridia bacterium]
MSFKSGFVAVVGKPNVGKSTLINALLGRKVSIVSPKAQTTRNNIMGVLNNPDYQIVFIDTPGIHKSKNSLDKFMQKSIDTATSNVDLLLYLLDGSREFDKSDIDTLSRYCTGNYPVFAVVNKIDTGSFESLYPKMAVLNTIPNLTAVYAISSTTGKNLDLLLSGILDKLTDNVKYFPDDEYTDKDIYFTLAEIIREKMLWILDDEIPHGVGVVIDNLEDNDNLSVVHATIFCERDSHKSIIIGNKGAMLSRIGTACREAMQKVLQKPVYLDLFVKVKPGWRDREGVISTLGYKDTK